MIAHLHYITQDVSGRSHAELAALACKGGVKWVQFRMKDKSDEACLAEATETLKVCKAYGARLIMNDRVLLAARIGADGVHLGKTDMAIEEARHILGKDALIGATANTFQDIERIEESSADYIGLGPFRFTETKQNLSPILGCEGYASLLEQAGTDGLPIIAIGGIRVGDVQDLMNIGMHGIAVSSAINLSKDPADAARQFLKALQKAILSGVRS